ncbi:MAG: hypothetical protein ACXV8I_08405, partial [Methylobacter sp.]
MSGDKCSGGFLRDPLENEVSCPANIFVQKLYEASFGVFLQSRTRKTTALLFNYFVINCVRKTLCQQAMKAEMN